MANTQLLEQLDAAIAKKNLLNHPFYQDWQAGKLTKENLQLVRRAILPPRGSVPETFARAGCTHGRLHPRHRRRKSGGRGNPAASHPKLWLDFAGALGVDEDDITCRRAMPGTQKVVQTFREICGDRSVREAVAALYAYEAQVPNRHTKIDGLKKFNNISQPEALAYFEVHEEADKAHRAAWRNWLADNATENHEEILATTNEALDALWGALDAVYQIKACSAVTN